MSGHPPPPRPLPLLLPAILLPLSLSLILHPILSATYTSPASPFQSLIHRIPYLSSLAARPSSFPALEASTGFAILAFLGSLHVVPALGEAFIAKGLKGRDMLKGDQGGIVPESMGLPCAAIYILLLMIFIPFPFSKYFEASLGAGGMRGRVSGVAGVTARTRDSDVGKVVGYDLGGGSELVLNEVIGELAFPHQELTLYLSSLLSLLTATLLGFLDDVFDIRWRHKLPIPLIASVPLLLVYYAEGGLTEVVLPRAFGMGGAMEWVGLGERVDLGPLYYLFMALISTFCTNSINILAGVNGIEVSQSLLIACSIALNDVFYLPVWPRIAFFESGDSRHWVLLEGGALVRRDSVELMQRHLGSLYFMLPLIGVCAGFLYHNWYPARAFPGDTFCYFSGMALAVVGIQGHFSKTLLLFFIPQILNFVLSCPQLFGLVPCPRHRLPKFDPTSGKLLPSKVEFERPPPKKTALVLRLLSILRLTRLEHHSETGQIKSATNLTIITVILVHFGPMREDNLTKFVMCMQVAGSCVAYGIRYGLGRLLYGGDRR